MFLRKGIPIIRISNLPQNASFVDLDDCTYYKEGNYNSFEVHNGDLLIAMSGATTGKTAIYNKKTLAYLNQRVGLFKSTNSDSLYYPFLYAIVSTPVFKRQLSTRLIAGAQPNISSSDIESIRISIPQKNEQEKIAHLMLLLDERIATQNKVIEDLKKLKSAIIEKHYSQVKKRTTCIADLGEPFSVGSLAKDDLTEIGSPCVIYGELFTTYGEIIFHIESCTNKTDGMILSKKGDLLFPSSTTVDAMSLIAPSVINVDGVVLGGDMFGIHISHNYNAQYLSYYFNHIAKKQLAKFAKGSTIIHLHYTDIEKAKLLLPSLEEQNRMAKCLVALDKKVSVEQNLLSSLTCQKSYLLQQMFI